MHVITLAFIPYLTKLLFDDVFSGERNMILFAYIIVAYILLTLIGILFSYINEIIGWKLAVKFDVILKRMHFNAVTQYDYDRFKEKGIGEYK